MSARHPCATEVPNRLDRRQEPRNLPVSQKFNCAKRAPVVRRFRQSCSALADPFKFCRGESLDYSAIISADSVAHGSRRVAPFNGRSINRFSSPTKADGKDSSASSSSASGATQSSPRAGTSISSASSVSPANVASGSRNSAASNCKATASAPATAASDAARPGQPVQTFHGAKRLIDQRLDQSFRFGPDVSENDRSCSPKLIVDRRFC